MILSPPSPGLQSPQHGTGCSPTFLNFFQKIERHPNAAKINFDKLNIDNGTVLRFHPNTFSILNLIVHAKLLPNQLINVPVLYSSFFLHSFTILPY